MDDETWLAQFDMHPRLKPADRCDRCNATALVRFSHDDTELDLIFCGHHARQHTTGLQSAKFLFYEDIRGWSA